MSKKALQILLENYKINKAKLDILNLKGSEISDDLRGKVLPLSIAIDALDKDQRQLLDLKYFKKCTHDDISFELGISTATVTRWNGKLLDQILEIINI